MDQSRGGSSAPAPSRALRFAQMGLLPALGLAVVVEIGFGISAGQSDIDGIALRSSVMLALAFAVGFFQFRNVLLSLAVALGPLPGAALAFCAGSRLPDELELPNALVYALGFAVAILAGEHYAQRIAHGETPERAAGEALGATARPLVAVLVAAVFLPCAVAFAMWPRTPVGALLLSAENAAAILSAWLIVPVAGSLGAHGEDFISRTNRLRESWSRTFERLTWTTRSPWNWSVSGIFIVLLASAAFGGARVDLSAISHSAAGAGVAAAAAAVVLASIIGARRWRSVAAIFAVVIATALFAGWGFERSHAVPGQTIALLTAELCAIVLVPLLAISTEAVRASRDDMAGAFEVGLVRAGPAAFFMLLANFVLLLPSYSIAGTSALAILLAFSFSIGAAFFVAPALATAIEAMFPRRQTLAERYKVK